MAKRLQLLPRGISIASQPGRTLLDNILDAGAYIRHSCNTGTCHVCRAKLLSGSVRTHQGDVIQAGKNAVASIMTCSCYAETDCTLEIAHVLAKGELPQHTLACQVQAVTPLNHDVTQYLLKLPAGKQPAYYPGQYLELLLNAGTAAEKSFPFSIANAPDNQRMLELHVRQVPDSESLALLQTAMAAGEIIHARLPSGACTLQHIYGDEALRSDNTPLVFLAGSTGFAPVKAMLEYCFAQDLQRPLVLYWGGRTADDIYQHPIALEWQSRHSNFQYVPVVSEPERSPDWTGRTGFVHKALMEDLLPFGKDLQIIAGGSPGMVHAAYDDFVAAGLEPGNIHSDVFAYAPR